MVQASQNNMFDIRAKPGLCGMFLISLKYRKLNKNEQSTHLCSITPKICTKIIHKFRELFFIHSSKF